MAIEIRDGVFASIATGQPGPEATRLGGITLPGLVNAHSHAFHRLLRGRTHTLGGDFWLWRERMYQVAGMLEPESYEKVATAVFIEMAMAGVTTVGEFHYLHHQTGGNPYSDPNEMGHSLIRAARRAGIRMALLDAGYLTAGFGGEELHPVQQRFSDGSAAAWLDRVEMLNETYRDASDVVVGVAPHSVRAVPEPALVDVARRVDEGTPVHIHVSEQPAENRECLDATGLTPTGLLARTGVLGPDTTLVHATHVTADDIAAMAKSGSGVCYCATTERDLADGIGPASDLAAAGVALCVGSDSHAVIDLFEESRGIELHSRLAKGQRGLIAAADLLTSATSVGSGSLGFPPRGLEVGAPADFIVVDTSSPRLAGMRQESALDTLVYAATGADIAAVFVGGRQIVSDGHHPEWDHAQQAMQHPDL